MICPDYQPRMLDLAYQLLEPAEAEAIRAHAASCTACAEALAEAGRMQGLMGQAAKLSFPNVRFEAPVTEIAAARKSAKITWLPWAVAAAVVLAIGISIPLARQPFAAKPAGDANTFVKLNTDGDKPKPPLVVIPDGHVLRETVQKEWTKSSDAKTYRILLIGPEKPAPNAENIYSITAADAKTKRLKVNVTVLVMDSTNVVVFKKDYETGAQITLPAAIWAKLAAGPVMMHVQATHPANGEKIELIIPLR